LEPGELISLKKPLPFKWFAVAIGMPAIIPIFHFLFNAYCNYGCESIWASSPLPKDLSHSKPAKISLWPLPKRSLKIAFSRQAVLVLLCSDSCFIAGQLYSTEGYQSPQIIVTAIKGLYTLALKRGLRKW